MNLLGGSGIIYKTNRIRSRSLIQIQNSEEKGIRIHNTEKNKEARKKRGERRENLKKNFHSMTFFGVTVINSVCK
jgi:hypothetical protein